MTVSYALVMANASVVSADALALALIVDVDTVDSTASVMT